MPDLSDSECEGCDECSCGHPCPPDASCEECALYWQRMEDEGLWQNGQWTNKGMQEIIRHS